MTFRVAVKRSAQREIAALPLPVRQRIDRHVLALADNPRPKGSKPLKGKRKGYVRIRVGDYRIIYTVEDDRLVVLVVRVAHRREVYRTP